MAAHNELGKQGELFAQNYLLEQGYKIRDVNWRTGNMELDIVAENAEWLVVVEVKTRASVEHSHPADAITNDRIRRLVNATHNYIMRYDIDKDPRFDLIFLIQHGDTFELEHIEDAFLPPLY